MDTLAKLFGSSAKVKTLKLFIFNPEEIFETKEIAQKAKINSREVRPQINILKSAGLIRKKSAFREVVRKKDKHPRKKRISGYCLNPDFHYLSQIRALLGSSDPESLKMVEKKLRDVGRIKLIIVSGFFIQDPDSRVDLLVVGDGIKKKVIENAVKTIEAEIGKELRYSVFETSEFQYRLSIYDKLLRDILEYPHKKLVNRLEV